MAVAAAATSIGRGVPAGRRIVGSVSLGLALAHVVLLVLFGHAPLWTAALVLMTAWCIKCSWCVLRGGSPISLMAMSAMMAVAHVAMVIGLPWFSGHHAVHAGPAHQHAALMLLMALAELVLMFCAAWSIRHSAPRTAAVP